jgi:glycosyltransferase involved in cell wall biosynthesis
MVVVSSQASARAALKLGASEDKIEQIVWYADLRRFGPQHRDPLLRPQLGWPDDALIALSLRNFRPDTNIDVIVRAFHRVIEHEPRARLLLAAKGGPLEGRIRDLVADLGLDAQVRFCVADEAHLPGLVASADVLVAMTQSDSTPASLLEAMASGLPAICADAASIDEWIGSGDGGQIVAQRDEAALADALLALLSDSALRHTHGTRNREFIAERLPTAGPGPSLEDVYRRVIASSAASGRPVRPDPSVLGLSKV